MKKEKTEEDLLSAVRSGSTGEVRILLHAGAKLRPKDDSRYLALGVRNKRIKPLCIAVACVLIGLLAACSSVSDSPETPGLKESDADLTNLTISSGILMPVFAADTTAYNAFIAYGVGSITITPTTSNPNATCNIRCDESSWAEVLSGSPCAPLAINVGTNTVEVLVTAEDGTTTKTYTIAVYRGILVPDESSKIKDAIDATVEGDWVLVRAGTYVENIVFPTDRSITVRSTNGPGSTIIDGGDNGSPVVTFPASGASSVLDGFTITNGHKTDPGAGGGGIDILQNSPTITNCIISDNSSKSGGGGIYCNNASPTITDCSFSGNSASLIPGIGPGGGMYNVNSSPTVTDCTFEGNDASGKGGGMYNGSGSPTVTNCSFSGNSAASGGGMYNISSSPTVINCTFSGNTATNNRGGGMHNDNSSPTVSKCSFLNNNAVNYPGSGMSNYSSSSPIVTNCLFYKNRPYTIGGSAMSNEGNSSPTVTNCTFFATDDKAIYNVNSSPTLTNCIVWGWILDMIWDEGTSSSVVTYTNVPSGGFPMVGAGNIYDKDPLFVDEANGDLHLQVSSPCIDAGDNDAPELPATDLDGDDRKIDGPVPDTGNGTAPIVDMGADEFAG